MAFFSLGKNHPAEIDIPPPSIAPPPNRIGDIGGVLSGDRTPPLYVYTQRREPQASVSFLMAPDDSLGARYSEEVIGWQNAPDPIRQSNFYAAGNKIHPGAQMRIPSNTAFGSIEAVDEQAFHIGKLIGYIHRPMYAGMQHPSVIRSNIQEALPSTYGSMYEVQGLHPTGGVVTPTGFVVPQETSSNTDGYPY
jgi:hypothetical protein